jgi:hypothetical protein
VNEVVTDLDVALFVAVLVAEHDMLSVFVTEALTEYDEV